VIRHVKQDLKTVIKKQICPLVRHLGAGGSGYLPPLILHPGMGLGDMSPSYL